MNSLCIDFGSTFIKFFVYDGKRVLFSDKLRFPEPCVHSGKVYEVPLGEIEASVWKVFAAAQTYEVQKCFVAVQMHGYVLRDRNGVFSNYISWKDRRADLTNPLWDRIDFRTNGTSLKSNLPAAKVLTGPRDCTFFTLGSYIAYFLTGRNITHKTDACASGLFDAETLEPVKEAKGMDLPEVTHKVLPVGTCQGVQIYTPVGDHQASFLGSGAGKDAYLLNIGTASQLSTLSNGGDACGDYESRPYFGGKRLLTVSGLTGGEALYGGACVEAFAEEVFGAIQKMPPKSKMLIGGGGASLVFEELKAYFSEHRIECAKVEKNISEEGLIKIVNMCDTKIGTMLSEVCFPNFPIILKNEKMEFLIVDNEHGAFDYGFLSAVVMNARLVGLPLIVRLPDNSRRDITKLVDMGVSGFLLPMTDKAEDIQRVVDYAKYAPIGKRGISTNRAHTLYNPPPIAEYMAQANERVRVYAQIETRAGVANIDEILSVNGVDGVFVGPNDLSCDMDCIGDNEPIKAALKAVSAAAQRHHKVWGIITTSQELIDCSLENGADLISYGSEINMLKNACKDIRKKFRG